MRTAPIRHFNLGRLPFLDMKANKNGGTYDPQELG